MFFFSNLARLMKSAEKGQDAAEYALLIGLIALAIIGSVILFGSDLAALYATIVTQFP